jgi:hypothetical protein
MRITDIILDFDIFSINNPNIPADFLINENGVIESPITVKMKGIISILIGLFK